ncbi:ParB/RepB/Spo0J family partition protein [Rhodovulum sp. DZ06]|uniref:ParB/RepB/Spo0J family partition protein n=1 Tax=Rhodovulum sp. DZ06 TaxID=3425126 RepID=UPI003D33B6AE
MSRRRVFQIDLPEDEPETEVPAPTPSRRGAGRPGPMASAVRENAESLRERKALEEAIRAENDALAHEHVRLKSEGLVLERIPLDAVDAEKLTRDRAPGEDAELPELIASIRELGLSNPIRVERHGDRFELVQGWRRLQAFKALLAETGEAAFATIPAAMAPEQDLETAYRRMVDENMVRKDISFAEMAELARAYAADPQIACADADKAVATLFKSAGYQKRSYIRAFAQLLEALGGRLKFAPALPRNLGLAVRARIEAEPGGLAELIQALEAHPDRDANEELAILRGFTAADDLAHDPEPGAAKPKPKARSGRAGKMTFRLSRPDGEAKCTAANGRLELRGETDFTAYDRQRLERAVAAFYAALDD